MDGLRKLLTCLDCPFAGTVNVALRADFVKLVSWLEDRKIRELEIAERSALKQDSMEFDGTLRGYLRQLQCPLQYTGGTTADADEVLQVAHWLTSFAIAVEYEDSADACRNIEVSMESETGTTTSIPSSSSSSTIEVLPPGFEEEVTKLGDILGVYRHNGDSIPSYLASISRHIRLLLSTSSVNVLKGTVSEDLTLNGFPLGFNTGDEVVNQAAIVLKMLHIFDFRELQTDLNSLIVLGQQFTANPRTNTKLGKVGK